MAKSQDLLANKKFFETLFQAVLNQPLADFKKTIQKSFSTYNKDFCSSEDSKISLKYLINDFKDAKSRNLLHFASSRGDLPIFKYLVEEGGDLSRKDEEENTPLFISAKNGRLDIVKYILDSLKLECHKETRKDGANLLHIACSIDNQELLNYILSKEIDINAVSELGTPLDWCIMHDKLPEANILISKGATVRSLNHNELPPSFILAISLHRNNIAKLLISVQKECIYHVDKHGWTALHVACEVGNIEMLTMLTEILEQEDKEKFEQLVNIKIENTTALDLAYKHEKWDCVSLLRKYTHDFVEPAKKEEILTKIDSDLALVKKNEGNQAFELKDYEHAFQLYSEAIENDPNNPVFYTNRAAALVRLGRTKEALLDAQKAKKIDKKWIKSYFREGEAYLLLNELGEAAASFWEGLQIEPNNKILMKAFKDAVAEGKKRVEEEKKK